LLKTVSFVQYTRHSPFKVEFNGDISAIGDDDGLLLSFEFFMPGFDSILPGRKIGDAFQPHLLQIA
jgi:hypothetical protein